MFVDVAVSNAGFGTLVVTASYGGDRAVQQRSVFAQPASTARTPSAWPAIRWPRSRTKTKQARLPALPAGTSYAVTVVAEGADGTIVAQGCVDGVAIESDAETPIEIAFQDQALKPKGEFVLSAGASTRSCRRARWRSCCAAPRKPRSSATRPDSRRRPTPRSLLCSTRSTRAAQRRLRRASRSADHAGRRDRRSLARRCRSTCARITRCRALLEIASRGPLAAAASMRDAEPGRSREPCASTASLVLGVDDRRGSRSARGGAGARKADKVVIDLDGQDQGHDRRALRTRRRTRSRSRACASTRSSARSRRTSCAAVASTAGTWGMAT